MKTRTLCIHRHAQRIVSLVLTVGLIAPTPVYAATTDATFELHSECFSSGQSRDENWSLGPIPSPGMIADTDLGDKVEYCEDFEVRDPQTLQTRELREGDILNIDVVIDNPSKQHIRRARAWLSYDPKMLEGISVDIDEEFSLVTPDENGFSASEGYVKMEASTEGRGPNDSKVLFAKLQFRVIETNPIGTPITFHDAQPAGHTVIMAVEGDDETYIQKEEPGVLLVRFNVDLNNFEPENTNEDSIFNQVPEPTPPAVDDNSCLRDEDCSDGICNAGQCQAKQALLPNGSQCIEDKECDSGICGSGICVPALDNAAQANVSDSQNSRTAFSLLQIRNLRVTTDGSAIFLAWDHLQSSQLKAYNVYYGTTSGRYIQRRTIDKSENSITLRSLPIGTRYYFAVRGLSTQDEESAFSQEVSIVVGEPDSSSAPLVVGSITAGPGKNPIASLPNDGTTGVPGETGSSSIALLFLLASAVIGTSFASKRQLTALSSLPNHE